MINPVQSSVSFKGVERIAAQDNFKGGMPAVTDVRGDYERAISSVDAIRQNAMDKVSSTLGNNLNIIA